jgi:hypothetical protein
MDVTLAGTLPWSGCATTSYLKNSRKNCCIDLPWVLFILRFAGNVKKKSLPPSDYFFS